MTFLGDEGRDVLIAKGILEGHFTLLGPRASAADFYLGPIYYYMMAPFLWLFKLDPVGPAIMVALVGIATVFLVYFVGKRLLNERAGLFAAALYAVSPLVITYSHSSWNPNVLPFFSILIVYLLYQAVTLTNRQWRYFGAIGFFLGIALQLHYLTLFLGAFVLIYTMIGLWQKHKITLFRPILKSYLFMFLGFIVGFSPFLAFEMRHGFANTKAIMSFVLGGTVDKMHPTNSTYFSTVSDVFFRLFAKLVFYFPDAQIQFPFLTPPVLGFLAVAIAFVSLSSLLVIRDKRAKWLLFLWFLIPLLLFGLYKKAIYEYYFAIFFPLPFLLVGNFLSQLCEIKQKKWRLPAIMLGSFLFIALLAINFSGNPFRKGPNYQKDQMKTIAEFVLSKTDNRPFNFALISGGNSDHAYRYFFEILNQKPVGIENTINDPHRNSVTKQLLVICEDPNCEPLGNSLFEVAGFGRASISAEWNVSVVKVYRLVPYVTH